MKSSINKTYIWVVLALLILLIFVLPRIFQVLTFDELGLNIYMALFGILITAVITQLLLHTQANEQQQVEKNTKVYREKLKTYKAFLDKIEVILSTDNPTRKDVDNLAILFMKMSIHLDCGKLDKISKMISCIFAEKDRYLVSFNEEDEHDEETESEKEVGYKQLFEIAQILRGELYPDSVTVKSESDSYEKIVGRLTELEASRKDYKNKKDKQLPSGEGECPEPAAEQVMPDIRLDNAEQKEEAEGDPEALGKALEASFKGIFADVGPWDYTPEIKRADNTCLYAYFPTQVVNMGKVFIGFHNEGGPEGWFFQCHLEFKDDNLRRQCYLSMRREFGGYMNKWCWWKPLPEEWAKRLDGRVADQQLCQYVTGMMKGVYDWVVKYKRTMELYHELVAWKSDKLPSWKISIWENSICTISDSESPMSMDIKILHDNGGKREIWITNQQHDASVLQNQLKEAGVADTPNTNGNLSYFHKHNKNGKDMIFDDNESLEKELGELLPKLSKVRKD